MRLSRQCRTIPAGNVGALAGADCRFLSDVDKALFRRKLADRLSLKTTLPLRPVVHLLTNGDWRLRDAAVQMMSKLGDEPLRALYSASRQLLGEE